MQLRFPIGNENINLKNHFLMLQVKVGTCETDAIFDSNFLFTATNTIFQFNFNFFFALFFDRGTRTNNFEKRTLRGIIETTEHVHNSVLDFSHFLRFLFCFFSSPPSTNNESFIN